MDKYIFDVDGTLTPSRGLIDLEFKMFFNTFCLTHDVYLVTGSDKPKTVEQISEATYNLAKRVYNCSGSEVWEGNKQVKVDNWKIPMHVKSWLQDKLEESTFPLRTGLHIEERSGMVNFSVVGRNASLYERKQYVDYDTKENERNTIAKAFNTMFPDLSAKVGGDTGIDISPRGCDKSQVVKDFDKQDKLWFFGDAIYEGGNDYPLAQVVKNYRKVTGWSQTKEYLEVFQDQRMAN